MSTITDGAKPRRKYRVQTPEVWAAIRAQFEVGAKGPELARRYDLQHSTIYQRAKREGWARRYEAAPELLPGPAPLDPLGIAKAALVRASEALSQGRAGDALALVRAADAVGAFAEFVARLEQRAAAGGLVAIDPVFTVERCPEPQP